ncbi:MAG: hypothetical protein FJ146_10120 [Deltaproteobacteria bacterium]|nr:hypothetical protein [Deltaproteobacteria bacterium]
MAFFVEFLLTLVCGTTGLGPTAWARETPSTPGLVILGDSLATGAATHPALRYDGLVLWDVFTGKVPLPATASVLPADLAAGLPDPLPAPQRLWPGQREFFGGPDWIWRNAMQIVARSFLDTPQYSWGYQLGLALKVAPESILIAGDDGARVAQLPRQVDRVLAATDGVLPPRIAVFFTGNDLCAATTNEITSAHDYAAILERGLRYMVRNGQVGASGTDVYVLGQLGVLQLLTSDSILNKNITAFGSETTCRALRDQRFLPTPEQQQVMQKRSGALAENRGAAWYFSMLMPPNPVGYCATLMGPLEGKEREAEISVVANHLRDYREATAKAVERLNEKMMAEHVAVRFHYVAATAQLGFDGADIAEDCFHLSPAGHTKIARAAFPGLVVP